MELVDSILLGRPTGAANDAKVGGIEIDRLHEMAESGPVICWSPIGCERDLEAVSWGSNHYLHCFLEITVSTVDLPEMGQALDCVVGGLAYDLICTIVEALGHPGAEVYDISPDKLSHWCHCH